MVRFSANEHVKMYRKEENDKKDKKVFLSEKILICKLTEYPVLSISNVQCTVLADHASDS